VEIVLATVNAGFIHVWNHGDTLAPILEAADAYARGEANLGFLALASQLLSGYSRREWSFEPPDLSSIALPYGECADLDVQKKFLYLETSRGCPPHEGFAIGLERLTQKVLGLASVKVAALCPRARKRTKPQTRQEPVAMAAAPGGIPCTRPSSTSRGYLEYHPQEDKPHYRTSLPNAPSSSGCSATGQR
jgi:hypothetical protein